jgi:hypothetical protein
MENKINKSIIATGHSTMRGVKIEINRSNRSVSTILIALIGAVAVIIGAIFGSPWFSDYVGRKIPEPTSNLKINEESESATHSF